MLFLLSLAMITVPVIGLVLVGWVLALQAVLLEQTGGIDALRRSRGMMLWHRRRLLACVLAVTYIDMALYSAPTCLLTVIFRT